MAKGDKPKDRRQWAAGAVELRPISDLVLRDTNPRAHSLEQIEQICASMNRFGWTIPVLVDEENVILAGHGRVRAARLMGFGEAPVVVARGWSADEKRAYVIADNQLAQNSEWDKKKLGSELRALRLAEFDMKLTGISDDDMQKLVIDKVPGETKTEAEDVHMLRCPVCNSLKRKPPEAT